MKEFRYNFIGNISLSDLNLFFNEEDWNYWVFKQTKYDVHSETKTIPLMMDESYNTRGSKTKYFKRFNQLIPQLENVIKKFYGDGQILRIEIVTLPKKSKVSPHRDYGESLQNDKRIHLVLQTNDNVIFTVDGEKKNMKLGELWEINNTKLHSVDNNGTTDRIHMIIDFKVVDINLI